MTVGALREIGTSYVGKEPLEHVADLLRAVLRRTMPELGFEVCLTSRPFVLTEATTDRPGSLGFGRTAGSPSVVAAADLDDGLAILARVGWRLHRGPLGEPPPTAGPTVTLVGPVAVEAQLVPTPYRMTSGGVSRHFIVERELDDGTLLCWDPVFGGLTTIAASAVRNQPAVRVEAPSTQPDLRTIAAACLVQGEAWRREAAAVTGQRVDRFSAMHDRASDLVRGAEALRASYSLQAVQLHALRWATAVAATGRVGARELTIVDLLRDLVLEARTALAGVTSSDVEQVSLGLRQLSVSTGVLTLLLEDTDLRGEADA